jgi:hypothetical protein
VNQVTEYIRNIPALTVKCARAAPNQGVAPVEIKQARKKGKSLISTSR